MTSWSIEVSSSCFFPKTKKRLVNKVKNAADLKQLKPSLLSIELTMSETPENLRIRVGEGPSQRMILLRGQPTELDPEAVVLLSEAGVLDSVAAAVLEVGEDEDEGQSGEEEAFEQEQKALEEREKEIASEGRRSLGVERWWRRSRSLAIGDFKLQASEGLCSSWSLQKASWPRTRRSSPGVLNRLPQNITPVAGILCWSLLRPMSYSWRPSPAIWGWVSVRGSSWAGRETCGRKAAW